MQDRRRWAASVGDQVAWRRAGGRRHYSATRQLRASFRRAELLAVVADYGGLLARGVQVRLARHFGVSEATISRDLRGILAPYGPARCPCCGAP